MRSFKSRYAISWKVFFNLVRALWNRRRARVGVYLTRYIQKQNIFLSGLSTKKVLMSLSNFALIKVLECSFTTSVFQSSQELVQMEWELERVCMNPSKFSNRKNFDPCALRKSTHVVVKFCAHKNLCIKKPRYAVSQKVFFNLLKNLFKRSEVWCRSVFLQVGSQTK